MDNEVLPFGYKIHASWRLYRWLWGVLIAIKNNFIYEPLAIVSLLINCEICAVSVKYTPGGADPLILISVYRPPNRDICYHQSLCNAIYDIATVHPHLLFIVLVT